MTPMVPTITASHRAAVAALGPNTPLPGITVLQKYEVERVLGRGAMGVVIGARHRHLDQRVAIKVMSTHMQRGDSGYHRALAEARAAARISSDHVVRVLDFLIDEDAHPCIVMEQLSGRDLSEVVQFGPLPITDAVGYVVHACDALACAQEAGVIHRDLKPANLFLTERPDGTPFVKVLDFGVSKIVGASGIDKSTGNLVVGSVAYMSPEQLAAPRDVDSRTDIWGLGVALYELLTGQLPFAGENVGNVVGEILTSVPVSASHHRPDVPAALDEVVRRCLEKSPSDRFSTFRALALALKPWAPAWAADEMAHLTAGLEAPSALPAPAHPVAVAAGSPEERWFGPKQVALALVILVGTATVTATVTRRSPPGAGLPGTVAASDGSGPSRAAAMAALPGGAPLPTGATPRTPTMPGRGEVARHATAALSPTPSSKEPSRKLRAAVARPAAFAAPSTKRRTAKIDLLDERR